MENWFFSKILKKAVLACFLHKKGPQKVKKVARSRKSAKSGQDQKKWKKGQNRALFCTFLNFLRGTRKNRAWPGNPVSKGKSEKVLVKKLKKLRIPRRRAQKKFPSVFGLAGYFFKSGQREWSYKGAFFCHLRPVFEQISCFFSFDVFFVFSACFLCMLYVCFYHV